VGQDKTIQDKVRQDSATEDNTWQDRKRDNNAKQDTHTRHTHTQLRETEKKKQDRTGVVEKDKYICVVKIPSPHLPPASLFSFLSSHNLKFLLPHTCDLPPLIGCVKFLFFCFDTVSVFIVFFSLFTRFLKRNKIKLGSQWQSWRWRCSSYMDSWRMSSVLTWLSLMGLVEADQNLGRLSAMCGASWAQV
jgi:hypothetical protein